jgi:transglutaminase-like putative cysteine protease
MKKLILLAILGGLGCTAAPQADYQSLIAKGEFNQAGQIIRHRLQQDNTVSAQLRTELLFELERLDRIRSDFNKSQTKVVEFIRRYVPAVTYQDLNRWQKERALESMLIDGEVRYFNHAARNLFRINKDCLRIWNEKHVDELSTPPAEGALHLDTHIKSIRDEAIRRHQPYSHPVQFRINYSISVNPDVTPDGERIRCWLPFPREIPQRQTNIRLISSEPASHQLASNTDLQRMIYLEKNAVKGQPTTFEVVYEYISHGFYADLDPDKVTPADPQGDLKPFLEEEYPHIIFTDTLKALSKQIVGDETNLYRIAQKLFIWVDENIPWASAREYSTIPNIPMYAYENRHGDCGIQTLLFITLCRVNGIPARWQSGWEFQPPDNSMHDWGMIYFEPYGWMPMDVTYGLRKTDDEKLKWFYLNGMDSYRLIFNDAITQPFTPAKTHFRSETVDSQRGEVEWSGGNLYFDQWNWEMKWEVVDK